MDKEKIYYVYRDIRLDKETCIYVGKGHGKRKNSYYRNEKHEAIRKSVGIRREILVSELDEETAFKLENETIKYYLSSGYGCDVDGYRDAGDEFHFLTNKTLGGRGLLGLSRPKHSERMSGANNPMFGINLWDRRNDSDNLKLKERISESTSGDKNPMYGISPKDRMTEEKYKIWLSSVQSRLKSQIGNKNPNSKSVAVYNSNGVFIQWFTCIKDCVRWILENHLSNASEKTIRQMINKSNNLGIKSYNLYFKKNVAMPINYQERDTELSL